MKVYLHLENQEGFPDSTLKIQIPKSWLEKPNSNVVELFASSYNKKNPDNNLELVDELHLTTSDGDKVYSDDLIKDTLNDRNDYYIKFGAHWRKRKGGKDEQDTKDLLRCRNYGCNQFFKESDNHQDACCHHVAPPIFHDTMKCWSCCKERKAYDFESFQAINGCVIGKHNHLAPDIAIAASPNAVDRSGASSSSSSAPAPVLKSISEFNASNPTAASSITSAMKVISDENRKSSRNEDGTTARCQRKGCQKTFNINENNPTACQYHKGQPVFHDAVKFWSCCPDRKCYDFDEFLAVKGCVTGLHDDGVIDLNEGTTA
jgi:hypothetical protein